jgi:peptidyl-prolyl cis-trans isomerase D
MQRHRKYLVITIWISTIAFVGAGFVGWGSYNYGSMSSNVGKVGKVEITKEEFSSAYSQIFNNYNKMLGGKLDEKEAKEMGIEKMALQSLVNQALLKNFANEFELQVTDEDVAQKIAQIKDFQKSGVFDKQTYLDVLKANRMNPEEYEKGLKQYLLIQTVAAFLKPQVTPLETKAIANASFGEDKVEVKVIKASEIPVQVSPEEIKSFWDKNKEKFKTKPAYDIDIAGVSSLGYKNSEEELKQAFNEYGSNFKDANGTQMSYEKSKPFVDMVEKKKKAKQDALKKFVALKKGEINGTKLTKTPIDNPSFPIQFAQELYKMSAPGSIKPIETENGFIFATVTKVYAPQPLTFDEAKPIAAQEVKREKAIAKLKEDAKNECKNFKGVNLGFISKADSKKLAFLAPEETQTFLSELFKSKKDNGFVLFNDKAVLYKISEQKLLSDSDYEMKKDFLNANIVPFKSSLISEGVIENLKKRYEVKLNIDISKN